MKHAAFIPTDPERKGRRSTSFAARVTGGGHLNVCGDILPAFGTFQSPSVNALERDFRDSRISAVSSLQFG